MKFYEDQKKLAAYLERTGAEFEYTAFEEDTGWTENETGASASWHLEHNLRIRPVLRYDLPSHLQSEIANPDNLTADQITEGGKYRACVVGERGNKGFQWWDKELKRWVVRHNSVSTLIGVEGLNTFRLPATVPWHDWEHEGEVWDEDMKAYVAKGLIDSPAQARKIIAVKEARIAELKSQLARYQWRPAYQVPTKEDYSEDGYVLCMLSDMTEPALVHFTNVGTYNVKVWMPIPSYTPPPESDFARIVRERGLTEEEIQIIKGGQA